MSNPLTGYFVSISLYAMLALLAFMVFVAYCVIGYVVNRTSDVFLPWVAKAVGENGGTLYQLLSDPPWRSSEFSGIFYWPSTLALLVIGSGAALTTRSSRG